MKKASLCLSLLAFMAFSAFLLYINKEVLYTAHERSEFIYGTPFFHALMQKPFGLLQYVGSWLTQFFYKPALGAGILLGIWVFIFLVGIKAFRLKDSAIALMLLPLACLLTSIVDLGYWIYIFPLRGYWFSQSLGYLTVLLLLWIAHYIPRRWHLLLYLVSACLYPILGWFSLLFILCLIVVEKQGWGELAGFGILIFTTSIWHTLLYSENKLENIMYAGFPHFENALDSSPSLSTPFWLLVTFSIIIPLYARYLNKWFVPVFCFFAGAIFSWSFMFSNKNYTDEMLMVRAAQEDNWKEVLAIAEGMNEPTTSMVMLKNVALMNEGGLLDNSFKFGNICYPMYNPDSLHVTFLEVASPLVYYNYGMLNESIRLGYENSIQEGLSPFYLKTLSRCALATGESNLMNRFLTLLHHHPFYDDWQPAPVTENVTELSKAYKDELTGIENSDRYIVNSISSWSESKSKIATEQALFYSMIRSDSRRFWASLRNFLKAHDGEVFPVHAQEAYIMYMDKSPEEKRVMLFVSQDVFNRYKDFWTTLESKVKPGVTLGEVADDMRKMWGDTYWYYNIFARKAY